MNLRSLLVISILLVSGIAHTQSTSESRMQAVENSLIPYVPVRNFAAWQLEERMRYHSIPGASIAVIRDYKIDWAKSYGLADTNSKVPVTTSTLFSAGSISKLVTAVVVHKLAERGKLSLDAPINNYLNSWKLKDNEFTGKKSITARMLLSHTAGTSQSAYYGYLPSKNPLPSIVQVLSGDSLAEVNPVVVNSEPGKEFRYSGGGFMILQMAVMDIMKKDFASIVEQEIFLPLGMKYSTFEQPLPAKFAKLAAWGYSAASWYQGTPYVYPQQAAAGLYSTPTDIALLLIELQKCYAGKGRLLKKETVRQMFEPVATISEGAYLEQMGLGAFLLEQKGNASPKGKYFEHQGANAGFISLAMGSIEGGNGVVVMMNSGDDFNGFGTELRRSVASVYGWTNFLPPAIEPVQLDDNTLNSYVGRYRKGPDEVVRIEREKDYLVEKINEGKRIYCFPIANDTIVFTDYNVLGFFGRDSLGKVISLRTEWASEKDAMPRMKEDEFTPSEHLRAGRYAEAKAGFAALRLNEYGITYLAFDWLKRKPFEPNAVRTLLEVAIEQHPSSAIVHNRWGDYYKAIGAREDAIRSYQRVLELEPGNKEVRAILQSF